MLTLAFTFPAGRYHATPWEHHVNEGVVVWPPEPWRVMRALVATWHHKVKHTGMHNKEVFAELVELLSQNLPQYQLPTASHSHTRHYMQQFKRGDTSLVFDAFAAVSRDEPLLMAWENVELSDSQQMLLDDLLAAMTYLGRAESWVEARIFDGEFQANCYPDDEVMDKEAGEMNSEIVPLFAPLSPADYVKLRQRHLPNKKAEKKLGVTLPPEFLNALSVETSDLRKLGWSQPPAARKVNYLRPIGALKAQRKTQKAAVPMATTITYMLIGKPLPRVEDSLRIGELLRRAVMSEAKKQLGEDAIPFVLSGHGLDTDAQAVAGKHRHAFFLPWDKNGDGRIERAILHVPEGMGHQERCIVEAIRKLYSRDGNAWRLVVEGIGGFDVAGGLLAQAAVWESVTPYLHPWYIKRRLSVEDQIRRECRERGLPEPMKLELLPSVHVGNHIRRPIHFHRFRSKPGLSQPDRHGSFWRLTFAEALHGPLALGFACHYGLGLFQPVGKDPDGTKGIHTKEVGGT